MIDFEEELKKFKPAPEIDDAERLIRNNIVSDLKDLISSVTAVREEQNTEEQQ